MHPVKPLTLTTAIAWISTLLVLVTVPTRLCSWHAFDYYDGNLVAQRELAKGAAEWLEQDPNKLAFRTGSARFDSEWYLIIHMAAVLGFVQTAREHSEFRVEHARFASRALERLMLPQGRAHDLAAWGEDPLTSLSDPRGHLAFLAYANLALSVHRLLGPESRFPEQNALITEALARRFEANPLPLLESYPGETYPADNAVAIASVLVFDRATGQNHHPQLRRSIAELRTVATAQSSGLLFQRVNSVNGSPEDAPRASGTAMAAFALGYADLELAKPFWSAVARQSTTHFGFGGIREYAPGTVGSGDVDSGPVVLGLSVSASGFALASARRFGDFERFRDLFSGAWLFGLPTSKGGAQHFAAGGPLGDVLLFALLTASKPS
jgi:hypothetical protein